MAYFQMDDGTDTELRVFKVGTAAFGLYARCGVWVARNLTDGFIPAEVAASYGTREWIDKLVASGLWTLEDGGFGMPDYLAKHDNKTAERVRELRAAAAARQAKLRANRGNGKRPNMSQGESRVTHAGSNAGSHTSLSDPPPKGGEEGASPLRGATPPPSPIKTTTGRLICPIHRLEISDTVPCRGCLADAKAADTDDDLDARPPTRHRGDRGQAPPAEAVPCPDCDCCTALRCWPDPAADCPTDEHGHSTCPCTSAADLATRPEPTEGGNQ